MFETQLNNNSRYNFDITLYSGITGEFRKLNPDVIKELIIEDDIFELFHYGTLIMINPQDILERVVDIPTSDGIIYSEFSYGNNTRDILQVEICPLISGDNETSEKIDISLFKLNFEFSIYNTEDIISNDGSKYKKLYFHEIKKQILCEYIPYFSTSQSLDTREAYYASNDDRSMYTGDAIKSLLTNVYAENNIEVSFDTYWNKGSSKIFYSSPSSIRSQDCLNYLYSHHTASDDNDNNSICLLKYDRQLDAFTFSPLSYYFDRAYIKGNPDKYGVFNIERFELVSLANYNKNIPNSNISPSDKTSTIFLAELSIFEDYTYKGAEGLIINNRFVPRAIHSYNFDTGTWDVRIKESIPKNVDNVAKELYYSKFKGNIDTGPTPTINYSNRMNQIINDYTYLKTDKVGYNLGQNKNLGVEMFLCDSLQFNCIGSTHRRTGRFIGINRSDNFTQNPFDNKLLGQHFVVNVQHIFKGRNYTNKITTAKQYKF